MKMAKQGQHKNDVRDSRKSRGPNKPDQSMTTTTGSYKKRETYEEQAREHKDPAAVGQHDKNEWHQDTHEPTPNTRARHPRSGRSGSDSDSSRRTRGN